MKKTVKNSTKEECGINNGSTTVRPLQTRDEISFIPNYYYHINDVEHTIYVNGMWDNK